MNDLEHLTGCIIGNFKMLRLIGSGGNGVVYLARQLTVDRMAACKILHRKMATNPVYIQNFVREARMAARLEHPHIIQAYDVGSGDGLYYFAMEYVPGISLEKIRISAADRITQPFLLDISISLADALDYAWKKFSIFHGDIKPDNLMIRDRDNVLKLADLGLARVAGTNDPDGEIMATPLYAAPEVIMGDTANVGIKSDIYSFGIMLYELLAGKAPFTGDIETVLHLHIDKIPPPLLEMNPGVDPAFAAFVDTMISKAPADRPADWAEIKKELQKIRKNIPDPGEQKKILRKMAANKNAAEKESKTVKRVFKRVFLVLTVILVLVIFAAVFLSLKQFFNF